MRKIIVSCMGLLLLAPAMVTAAAPSIYDTMRSIGNMEMIRNNAGEPAAEVAVKQYVAALFNEQLLQPDDIDAALRDDREFCKERTAGTTTRPALNLLDCNRLSEEIIRIVQREERVRTLGRDLQIIASSNELPVTGVVAGRTNLPVRAQSIMRIWRAGSGSSAATQTGVIIRSFVFPVEAQKPLEDLHAALQKLQGSPSSAGPDEFTAAVWRYEYGVGFVTGKFSPEFPPPKDDTAPGTERQYLYKHWTAASGAPVEEALTQLSLLLPKSFVPPLGRTEAAVFRLADDATAPGFQAKNQFDELGIAVWGTVETVDGKQIIDAGLQWLMPVEPVLPSLCKDAVAGSACDPILGGAVPPDSKDGMGLCLQPLSRNGYLCRDMTASQNPSVCRQQIGSASDAITLAACTSAEPAIVTTGGPDVCRDTNWMLPRAPDPVKQCNLVFQCAAAAPVAAHRFPLKKILTGPVGKQEGTIVIATPAGTELPTEYALMQSLTQARQICDLPAGTDPYTLGGITQMNNSCCRLEMDANRVACEAMQADTLFGNEQSLNTAYNAVTCADILTDSTCRSRGFGKCAGTFTSGNTDAVVQSWRTALVNVIRTRWTELHAGDIKADPAYGSCNALLGNTGTSGIAPRINGIVQTIKQIGREVCTPLARTQFENTIGNNLCYLGQCLEQTYEQHRTTPGRQPLTVQDEAYPWDACMLPSRTAGALTTGGTELGTNLPLYRPQLLVQQLDEALCQMNGLPPQSSPVRCAFDITRRLLLPLTSLRTSLSILDQTSEQRSAAQGLQGMSEAIGSRVGTQLYVDYLGRSARALSVVTKNAATLLETFTKVTFTRAMCPQNDAAGDALHATPFCLP
ncbi:MAG: hypothetical protein JWM56_442 [Candidatus Peribacteria bacterium]|nr:hypothetical protein [Candidatus Peribacteria bacterium]